MNDFHTRTEQALDLVLFFAMAACARSLGWKARDLVWGFWVSSLTVGYLTLVVGLVQMFFIDPPGPMRFLPAAKKIAASSAAAFFFVDFFRPISGRFITGTASS